MSLAGLYSPGAVMAGAGRGATPAAPMSAPINPVPGPLAVGGLTAADINRGGIFDVF